MNASSLIITVHYFEKVLFKPISSHYLCIQCGKDNSVIDLKMQGDNEGASISERNEYWSEITGIYWFYKNYDYSNFKYIGSCSYRRFFDFSRFQGRIANVVNSRDSGIIDNLDTRQVDSILTKNDVILPNSYTYSVPLAVVISNNYNLKDFIILRDMIEKMSPDYLRTFDRILKGNKAIGHNLFIFRVKYYKEFCSFVFPLLFEVEKHTNPEGYPKKQIRLYGYMFEILLQVFVEAEGLKIYKSSFTFFDDKVGNIRFDKIWYRALAQLHFFIFYRLRPFSL